MKKLLLIAATSTVLASSVASFADENQFYVKISANALMLNKSKLGKEYDEGEMKFNTAPLFELGVGLYWCENVRADLSFGYAQVTSKGSETNTMLSKFNSLEKRNEQLLSGLSPQIQQLKPSHYFTDLNATRARAIARAIAINIEIRQAGATGYGAAVANTKTADATTCTLTEAEILALNETHIQTAMQAATQVAGNATASGGAIYTGGNEGKLLEIRDILGIAINAQNLVHKINLDYPFCLLARARLAKLMAEGVNQATMTKHRSNMTELEDRIKLMKAQHEALYSSKDTAQAALVELLEAQANQQRIDQDTTADPKEKEEAKDKLDKAQEELLKCCDSSPSTQSSDSAAQPPPTERKKIKATIVPIIASIYYEHDISIAKVFVGGGVGTAFVTEKGSADKTTKKTNNFAYQLTAGVSTDLTSDVKLDLAYSWKDYGKGKSKIAYRGHGLNAAIRFLF